jgi:predicted DNA-binding transcriptional regulator YafY
VPVEVIAESLPPEAGPLRPDGEHSCVLETGSDSLRELIRYLTGLDTAFEVLDPPELRTLLRELADRYAAAAGAVSEVTPPRR